MQNNFRKNQGLNVIDFKKRIPAKIAKNLSLRKRLRVHQLFFK